MRTHAFATVAVVGLLLAGCSSTPHVERDEAAYLELTRSLAGESADLSDDAEMIEQGDTLCDLARSNEEKLSDGLPFLDNLLASDPAYASQADYWDAVVVGASAHLCQDVA